MPSLSRPFKKPVKEGNTVAGTAADTAGTVTNPVSATVGDGDTGVY
ncbi:hypothetical protein [Myxococcus sp. Y35]